MQDKADIFTLDFLNAPAPGRPRTATAEKKKADAAERARRYRQNKKLSPVSSLGCIVNTHQVDLCRETEDDFLVIYNYAKWLSLAVDADGNPSPSFFSSLSHHTEEIMQRVQAIAARANVVWCNPPINADLWQLDRQD